MSSKPTIRPSTPEDASAIGDLLSKVGLRANSDPQHLQWKYWQLRADWPDPRSFVVANEGVILAHAGIIPGMCNLHGDRMRMIHVIDWAASPDAAGAGLSLTRFVARATDAMLVIGGTQQAMGFLPRFGFQSLGQVIGYVRPLRPLKFFKHAPISPGWRRLPRFARSAYWAATAPSSRGSRWETKRMNADDVGSLTSILTGAGHDVAHLARSEAAFKYALTCPIAPIECYSVSEGGRLRGFFLLAFAGLQARMVDYAIDSAEPADWESLIQCAVVTARRNAHVVELVTWSSDAMLSRCLQGCGFHARKSHEMKVATRKRVDFSTVKTRIHMLDNDAAYLHEPGPEKLGLSPFQR